MQRWVELESALQQWYENWPDEMKPVFTTFDRTRDTFPIVVFSNPPAISGNQLYHAASLLMLQAKQRDAEAIYHRSVFWHACQIIGISASNRNR